ncbi:MAG: hypothetical protein KatS3mg077_0924 [Candidatus Binatia bacterium]|nr:MAG: hypothetical protein KatS3mg077_0924 [Candidatus Binatia bacterium]
MEKPFPKIIGHRGCRAPGVRENTAAAAAKAVAEGADIVEFDVIQTKDGHFVALHWPDLRFLFSPPWERRLEELPPVSTVGEILSALGNRTGVYLDIKQPLSDRQFLELSQIVDSFQFSLVVVGSFQRGVLSACREHKPNWIVNFDCLPTHRAVRQAIELGAHWINPIPYGVRRSFVELVLDSGLKFVPAGNESDRRQLRFARWGAHALSTFRPAHLRRLLAARLYPGAPVPDCHSAEDTRPSVACHPARRG